MMEHLITNTRVVFSLLLILCVQFIAHGQKYTLAKSRIEFFSDATIEDIKSENTKSSGLLNTANGEVVFSVPIRDFEFAKALMKEHFNEKYMESEKFPKAIFKGKFHGLANRSGLQSVTASGTLTIHGVTRDVDIPGTIEISGDQLIAKSKFIIRLEDYKVKIPQLLWQNIAEEVEVTVEFTYKPL